MSYNGFIGYGNWLERCASHRFKSTVESPILRILLMKWQYSKQEISDKSMRCYCPLSNGLFFAMCMRNFYFSDSEDEGWINGSIIFIDFGYSLNLQDKESHRLSFIQIFYFVILFQLEKSA